VAFRITFIAGINEGIMPHLKPRGWLLQEETMQKWPNHHCLPTNVEQLLRERLLFFSMVNTAREKLILSCCQTGAEGEILNPSSFWEDVIRILPDGQYRKEVKTDQLSMARQINKAPATLESEIRQKIRDELARRKTDTNGQLGEKATALLQSIWTTKPLSISALESYGVCPFSYFCRYCLQIKPLAEPEIIPSRLAEGSIAHLILKDFFCQHRGEVLQKNRLKTYMEEIRALVERYYPHTAAETSMLRHNLLVLGRENLVSTLNRVLQEEVDWGEKTNGGFTPRYLELGFGGITEEADVQSTPTPLVLSIEGASAEQPPLKLWGKIDRVDTDQAGNFVVYDYKSGKAPTKAEITTGKRLQLPFYLLAVHQLFRPGGKPVGAAYYSLRQADRLRGIWHQKALDYGIKSKGALGDDEWEEILGNAVTVAFRSYYGMIKGKFPFCPPNQCPRYCVYQSICHHLSWGGRDEEDAE
jgi:ATP-dependent helicase/DNAse subunit B